MEAVIRPDLAVIRPLFKRGDMVRLKSGGPLMMVNAEIPNESCWEYCCWFDGKTYCTQSFMGCNLEHGYKGILEE